MKSIIPDHVKKGKEKNFKILASDIWNNSKLNLGPNLKENRTK